jgi:two-component system sensor histidine kinase SenX3
MPIYSRNRAIAFFIVLGACSVALALALNITWMIHWRQIGMAVLGIIFFSVIIAGVTLNTIFLVREMRRSEKHDSFINAVTHELKTPIASIRLYLETLQSRQLTDAQRKHFYGVMLDDTDRLINTVDKVLRAGHLGQKSPKHFQRVQLAELARDCSTLIQTRHHLRPESVRFVDYCLSEPYVMGDPEELRSAINNLLENAVKYSPTKIAITVEVLDEAGDVLVRVSDKGQGIPPGELKRIFRRFYRVTLRQRVKGTGLGLFIVSSIARRHGGSAYATSEGEGRGATVTLRLPREPA